MRADESRPGATGRLDDGQPSVQGSNIRLGTGSADVFASHSDGRYVTKVSLDGLRLHRLLLGATLPSSARVAAVYLDGRRLKHYGAERTNRGLEVTAQPHGRGGWHSLQVVSR